MAVNPFFSLTPTNPYVLTYDGANPTNPYASATLYTYGGITLGNSPSFRLSTQAANDEIFLGFNPVNPTQDLTITDIVNDVYNRSCAQFYFTGVNVSTENQYLLLFSLRAVYGSPTAQFFVGTDLVSTEALNGEEQVAVLLDCPGNNVWMSVYVRVAGPTYYTSMAIKGMDCFLL